MKPTWNSLLIALNLVLLSSGTPVVLAEPIAPVVAKEKSSTSATELTIPPNLVVQTERRQPTQPSPAKPAQTDKPETTAPSKLAEVMQRRQKLIEADRLYLGGQFAAAEKLYREVKAPFAGATQTQKLAEPILDPAQLSPAGKVYWREARAGTAEKLQTRVMVPLRLLVEQYPQFIPGHLRLAQALQQSGHAKEAIDVLERATTLYPAQPELVKAKVTALAAEEKWMEASLAARQYALLNYNQPDATQFNQLAEEHLKRYRKHLRSELRGNAIANVITGALGYALTGSLLGPFSAVQTGTMLLRGESKVGASIAKDAREQLEIVEDKAVVDYVNEIGQRLAQVAGRNEFKYEFYVVLEDDLNAFALPGGKVFVNAGAIARTNSEAELAGLLAHELSHAVLSHGFQLVAEGNLLANVTQFVPYGGTVANLFTLKYSRDMERQADTLGTRLIASTGYAADGVRNLMVTLEQQDKSSPPSWLASHPATDDRIRYLENLIERNRYNRYAYEGVERHAQIKAQAEKLLIPKEQQRRKKHHP
jgi:predicted Zn-dependent protease